MLAGENGLGRSASIGYAGWMHPRTVVVLAALAITVPALAQTRPTIMITGYWPPTSAMLRDWSPIPSQNPEWTGSDWEGRGFDVKAYFPEFPGLTAPTGGAARAT